MVKTTAYSLTFVCTITDHNLYMFTVQWYNTGFIYFGSIRSGIMRDLKMNEQDMEKNKMRKRGIFEVGF